MNSNFTSLHHAITAIQPLLKKGNRKSMQFSVILLLFTFIVNITKAQTCSISAITATPTACNASTNLYSVSGTITFTNAPTSGSLYVRVANGQSIQFDTPFTSPLSYTLVGLNSDGASHNVIANFSVYDPGTSCSSTVAYTAPTSCIAAPVCAIGQVSKTESYSFTVPQGTTNINNYMMTGIKKFDTKGGTRILSKALITLNSTVIQNAIIESIDNEAQVFGFTAGSSANIKIGAGGAALLTNATSYTVDEESGQGYPVSPGISVSAQGTYPGDNMTGVTLSSMGPLVGQALADNTDPRLTTDWVTIATGNPLTDDDMAYISPIHYVRTQNLLYTAASDLATVTGSGDLDLLFGASGNFNTSGSGNFSTRVRTNATGTATITYYYCEIPTVSLGSMVFNDTNDNGIQDTGEAGIDGASVQLYMYNGTSYVPVGTPFITTGGTGAYYFPNLLPGDYKVGVTPPAGFPVSSTDIATSANPNNDVDGDDNGVQTVSGGEALSNPITLTVGGETGTETGGGSTQDDEDENSGNMSLDFGFHVTTLPIDLLGFTASKFEESINLTWKTANEKEFSHFDLQKSSDAKEFGVLQTVKATNKNLYNFADTNPIEGNNYYRLKMVDLDGLFKYSKTISINFEKGGNFISVQNPATNGEFVIVTNFKNPQFTLLNSMGQRIGATIIATSNNKFILKATNQITGVHFLNVVSEGKMATKKVLFY